MKGRTVRLLFSLIVVILLVKTGSAIRCSVCDTGSASMGGGGASAPACLLRPPPPQLCEEGLDYCIEVTKYKKSGRLHSYTRSCSPFSLPESCMGGVDKASGEPLQICYTTCARDGCNGSTSLHHVLDLLRRR